MTIEQEASSLLDPHINTDPAQVYRLLAKLRREKPVCKVESEGIRPIWLVTKNEDITYIESNSEIFYAGPRPAVRTIAEEQLAEEMGQEGSTLVEMDGDQHRKYRHIAQAWFMPRSLKTIDGAIKASAKRYVDLMESKAPACDFASEVAFWYPLRVILSLADVPEEADAAVVKLTQNLFAPTDDDFAGEQLTQPQAAQRIHEFLAPLVAEKKKNPGDDLVSVIVHAEVDGEPIDMQAILSYLLIIVTAGHDTTSASLAGGLLALMQHPDQLQKLKDKPELIPSAVDEIVRWTAPVKHFARTAMEDATVGGVTIPKGDSVMMLFASASRDEAQFPDAGKFDIERKPNQHMAFGYGPHVCMGKYLAKMELEAFLRELLPRLESVELNGEPKYVASRLVSGLKSLPVKYQFK